MTSLEPLDTSSSGGGGTSLTISVCEEILTDAHLGDSIAVNGKRTYLTQESLTGNHRAFISMERGGGARLELTAYRNMPDSNSLRQNLVQGWRRP